MRRTIRLAALALIAAAAPIANLARADLITTYTSESTLNSSGDGPKQGQATIALDATTHTVTITLESLVKDPTGAGQEVSGIILNFNSGVGSASFASTPTATAVTINGNGSFTQTPNTNLLTGNYTWGVGTTNSNQTVTVAAAGSGSQGGKPFGLIIGPTSNGTYNTTGLYDNANSSITGHGPVQGPVTFTLSASGVNALTTLSSVSFEFGTGPDQTLGGSLPPPIITNTAVPEPSTVALVATSLPFGLVMWLKKRRKARAA